MISYRLPIECRIIRLLSILNIRLRRARVRHALLVAIMSLMLSSRACKILPMGFGRCI